MTTIANAFENVLLADATYALEDNGLLNLTGVSLERLLKDRMTGDLAKYIGENFVMIAHMDSSDVSPTAAHPGNAKAHHDGWAPERLWVAALLSDRP